MMMRINIGLSAVLIHFMFGCSLLFHPAIYWGTPMTSWNPPAGHVELLAEGLRCLAASKRPNFFDISGVLRQGRSSKWLPSGYVKIAIENGHL